MDRKRPKPKPLQPSLHPFPAVSVIVTAYNAASFLAEAVTSILRQPTSIPTEILLVDDGSTDGTTELARSLAAQHPSRLRLLHHPGRRNLGISASRNLALAEARAPITAFLDADDCWLPHRLSSQLTLIEDRPRVAMLYAQAERWLDHHLPYSRLVGPLGRNHVPSLLPPGQRPGLLPDGHLLSWFLEEESYTPCTCTVLVRTEVARAVGGFVAPFTGLFDDQVFYSKIALEYPIFASLDVVARYRQHPASCCATARNTPAYAIARTRFLDWLTAYREERRLASAPTHKPAAASTTPTLDAHAQPSTETQPLTAAL